MGVFPFLAVVVGVRAIDLRDGAAPGLGFESRIIRKLRVCGFLIGEFRKRRDKVQELSTEISRVLDARVADTTNRG